MERETEKEIGGRARGEETGQRNQERKDVGMEGR
jgi:hypothetical protein